MSAAPRAVVALAFACLAGCGSAPGWVDAAVYAHHRADAALAAGDVLAARTVLTGFLEHPAPATLSEGDQRRVLQDVYYRLASLETDSNPRTAVSWADQGLALGQEVDVFTANLLIARGHARERLGEDRAAAEDYHRALALDEALLNEGGNPP